MCTHNIPFHDKKTSLKYPEIYVILSSEEFIRVYKRVRISHGKSHLSFTTTFIVDFALLIKC